jgi:drug/metabolite transporter (DMT)-like permease
MPSSAEQSSWKYIALIALGAFCYSTLIIFTRLTQGLDAMSVAFFRTFFAFAFFCILLIFIREPLQVRAYARQIGWLVALGVAVGVTAVLYIYAIQHTTAANASLLVNSAPIYIAIISPWFLREARPKYTFLSLILLMVGVVLITNLTQLSFDLASLDGIMAGFLSGLTYSTTFMLSRRLRGKVSSFTQTLWGSGVAALILTPFVFKVPWPVIVDNLPVLVPLGVVTLGISSFVYYIALQRLKAQVVSNTAILEPVSGVFIGLLIFQEVPGVLGVVGIVLILASIYLITR